MKTKRFVRTAMLTALLLSIALVGLALTSRGQAADQSALPGLTQMQRLGKALFFDENLSFNKNQSCATCHEPGVGYTGPSQLINRHGAVYEGSIPGAFGNRKPPTAAYAGDSPNLHFDAERVVWVGGMFWDGRATGAVLGDPLAEQAKGPFLNPKEQAVPDAQTLCQKVAASRYAKLYNQVWGSLDCTTGVALAYDNIGRAIAAFERSSEVSAYTSPFDRFWDKAKSNGLDVTQIDKSNWAKYAKLGFSSDELRGLAIYNSTAGCSACHTLHAGPAGYPLFTDFTYDNLGMPKNPENPATLADPTWADPGLGGYLKSAGYPEAVYSTEMGKFKVPTLRNVDQRLCNPALIKAYGHNGYFKSLEDIVHFYNTRDVGRWPVPEISANVNHVQMGNLKLNKTEERSIVAFLKTLSDGTCQ